MLIVIEGNDGSGKATQTNLLVKRLKKEGFQCKKISFPQYRKGSSFFIRKYLKGEFGNVDEVSPYIASIFYALDRYEASFRIKKWLEENKIVIADRYELSNEAHQGSKIESARERRRFRVWLRKLEFEIFKIPKPNAIIYLHMPYKVAIQLLKKEKKEKDIHEKDIEYLRKTQLAYLEAIREWKNCFVIKCTENGKLLSIKEISERIYGLVKKLLQD